MEWIVLAVVAFVVIGVVGWIVGLYNSLILVKHNVEKAWANIDVILKQRHDELPKLIDTCKGYMKHERSLLEGLTEARTRFLNAPTMAEKTVAENQLERGLKSLFAVAENYPDLKANSSFLQLQGRISQLEDMIADRREFFNDSVNVHNVKIEQFPDMLLAGPMGMSKKPLLEIPKEETKDVKIDFNG